MRIDFTDTQGQPQWLEAREYLTIGDQEHIELKSLERGGSTPQLAIIDLIERIATAWSYPDPLTRQLLMERLPHAMIADLTKVIAGTQSPNGSGPSSTGTARTKAASGESRRSHGG